MSNATLPVDPITAGFEQYRPALTGHCYRMLGPVVDAEDFSRAEAEAARVAARLEALSAEVGRAAEALRAGR